MELFKRGFNGKRAPPPHVLTDAVFPMHYFDDSTINRGIVLFWTLRFNDVLDADKLHDALSTLLTIGDWKRIGGRLRERPDGKLEIHVPDTFTAKRPAVGYTHETFKQSMKEHPIASQLPQATNRPSVQADPKDFTLLALGKGSPRTIEEYLYTDAPQLSLHIVSFTDATLVTLIWPHTLTDALGCQAIMVNWCRVLAGREEEVSPLLGSRDDPLKNIGTGPIHEREEVWGLQDQLIGGISMLIWALRFAWEMIFLPKQISHTIFLPAASVKALKTRALDDLGVHSSAGDVKTPFITDGDVLTAWATRLACLHLHSQSQQPISVHNVFEVRRRLLETFQTGAAYVNNLMFQSWTLFTVAELVNEPIGKLALKIRTALNEQVTEGQIRGLLRIMRHSLDNLKMPPLVLRSTSTMITFTNWTKCDFYNVVDFSPAIVKSGVPSDTRPGRPVYYHASPIHPPIAMRNLYNIAGQDCTGNYWLVGVLPPQAWSKIEGELRKM